MDKVQKIREEVERLKLCTMDEHMKFYSESAEAEYYALCKVEEIIDSLQEEPVSEELEEALAGEWKGYNSRGAATVDALEDNTQELAFAKGFYRGAQWGKNQAMAEIQAQSMALAHGCPKESVTEDLEKAADEYADGENPTCPCEECLIKTFKAGAQWQKERLIEKVCERFKKYLSQFYSGLAMINAETDDFRKALEED